LASWCITLRDPINRVALLTWHVPQALALVFPTPGILDLSNVLSLQTTPWEAFNRELPFVVGAHQHLLGDHEAQTFFYCNLFVVPVINSLNINRLNRYQQHFAINHNLDIAVQQTGNPALTQPCIDIAGVCGVRITCNNDPFCVVELKQYDDPAVHFDEGRNQALLYAATYGHMRHMPRVLAIVTDLARWQFFTVSENNYTASPVRQVDFAQDGTPTHLLRRVLRQTHWFLNSQWPADEHQP
jgi:hypothetical protein